MWITMRKIDCLFAKADLRGKVRCCGDFFGDSEEDSVVEDEVVAGGTNPLGE